MTWQSTVARNTKVEARDYADPIARCYSLLQSVVDSGCHADRNCEPKIWHKLIPNWINFAMPQQNAWHAELRICRHKDSHRQKWSTQGCEPSAIKSCCAEVELQLRVAFQIFATGNNHIHDIAQADSNFVSWGSKNCPMAVLWQVALWHWRHLRARFRPPERKKDVTRNAVTSSPCAKSLRTVGLKIMTYTEWTPIFFSIVFLCRSSCSVLDDATEIVVLTQAQPAKRSNEHKIHKINIKRPPKQYAVTIWLWSVDHLLSDFSSLIQGSAPDDGNKRKRTKRQQHSSSRYGWDILRYSASIPNSNAATPTSFKIKQQKHEKEWTAAMQRTSLWNLKEVPIINSSTVSILYKVSSNTLHKLPASVEVVNQSGQLRRGTKLLDTSLWRCVVPVTVLWSSLIWPCMAPYLWALQCCHLRIQMDVSWSSTGRIRLPIWASVAMYSVGLGYHGLLTRKKLLLGNPKPG